MPVSVKLSPMSSYYLRRLIQTQKELLLSSGDSDSVDAMVQLDPEGILLRLGLTELEIAQRIKELEVLIRAHQSLATEGRYPQEMKDLELQIFTLLGWRTPQETMQPSTEAVSQPIVLTGEVALRILQDLLTASAGYLGNKLSGDYLKGTCPVEEWANQLTIQKGNVLEVAYFTEQILEQVLIDSDLANLRTWIIQFLRRCSSIISGFHEIANQGDFKILSITPSDIESP